jgi:hypothetical protein
MCGVDVYRLRSSTIFFNSLPTLKKGNFFGFTSTAFSVWGFFPV